MCVLTFVHACSNGKRSKFWHFSPQLWVLLHPHICGLSPYGYKAAKVLTVQRQAIILSIGSDGAVEKNMPSNLKIKKRILWLKNFYVTINQIYFNEIPRSTIRILLTVMWIRKLRQYYKVQQCTTEAKDSPPLVHLIISSSFAVTSINLTRPTFNISISMSGFPFPNHFYKIDWAIYNKILK